jgi:predicted ATPase
VKAMVHELSIDQISRLRNAFLECREKGEIINTRWSIISGPPFSGKTTLLEAMAERGNIVVQDAARAEINESLKKGGDKVAVRADYDDLQERISSRMMNASSKLRTEQSIFWDYSFPDNLAFIEMQGRKWSKKHLDAAIKYRFANVFICQPVGGFVDLAFDPVRIESAGDSRRIFKLLISIYEILEYKPIILPPESVDSRLRAISSANSNL